MRDQSFQILQYDELRALVGRGAQTPLGRRRVGEMAPFTGPEELQAALRSVAEFSWLAGRSSSPASFSGVADPSEALASLRIGGMALDALTMLQLARLCGQALFARAMIQAERERCIELWRRVSGLPSRELQSLAARISSKILPSGEIDDRASPELARLRHEITRVRERITRSLEALMRRSAEAIQDEIVTIRNDRFVIPVKSDHRGRLQGVAHGSSSSGATVFVEPLETIDANNELQALRETEEIEVHRILFALTDDIRGELTGIEMAAEVVADLDFLGAKAVFLSKFDCIVPEVGDEYVLDLDGARHPLLEENLRKTGKSVVPVAFRLDPEHAVMVISGANAGGKTVVLKTAGLLALMALSGLPVPARRARFPFYATVLADIGDHQSLAANLSTFTAHVENISRMIDICESPALVLLDEVGTGTDPDEGSALGVAIVDHFRRSCGAQVLATTHYSGLKMYAANEEAVLNASVEFDEKTLQPTYRLLVGVAGSSSGLEIARRFGFPEAIVSEARNRVAGSVREIAQYLERIKRGAQEAELLSRALEEERTAVAQKYSSLEHEAQRRERQRVARLERDFEEATKELERSMREVIAGIQDRAERARAEREAQKKSAELRREGKARVARATATAVNSASPEPPGRVRVIRDGRILERDNLPPPAERAMPQTSNARPIAKGDRVWVRAFGSAGIVENIQDDTAEVRVKSLRLREKLKNLELLADSPPEAESDRAALARNAAGRTEVRLRPSPENPRAELNLIGSRADEAVEQTDKFLDEAFLGGLRHVRIVHGHGTGALRRAITNHLGSHPHVERFSEAPQNQGGAGATVVELKQ